MTWSAQVRHVFVRNLADTWVSLAVAVALIAVVATQAVLGRLDEMWEGMLMDYAVRLAILFHLALVVQADPPPHPGSFWATQPREPSAVAAAKLLHVLVMLGLLIAALLVVQSAWHFGSVAAWEVICAQLRYNTILVVPVMFLASLYPAKPRAGFGVAAFCLSWGSLVDSASRSAPPILPKMLRAVDVLPSWIWVPVVALLVVFLIWRYGRAELSPRTEWPVSVFLIVPFALLLRGDPLPRPRVADASAPPSLALTLESSGDYLVFELQAPHGLPGDAYRLVNWTMTTTRSDGRTVRLNGSDDVLRRSDGRRAIVRLAGDSLRAIGGERLDMHDSTSFQDIVGSYGLFGNDTFDDVVSARLDGMIESYRVEEVDRFPLQNGRAFLRDGRQATVTMLPADTAGPGIALRTKWLGGTAVERAAWPVVRGMSASDLSFALVNRARGSMLPLRVADSDYFGMGTTKMGFGVRAYDYTLRPAIWTLPIPPVDSAWLASAEVVVGTPVLTGAMRIQVDGVVATSSRR